MIQMLPRLKKYFPSNRKLVFFTLLLTIVITASVFLPGISGPFIFDDFPNITANKALRIQSLSFSELHQAAYSFPAVGPLQRPLAYASFALNGYFAGSFDNSTPFKLTNLFIHIVNALLIFWMLRLVLSRYARSFSGTSNRSVRNIAMLLSAAIAILWLIHPIQITSVLYVVQRMTSLSSTFVLLGVLSYLIGRERLISNRNLSYPLMIGGPIFFGVIGVLVKEIAVLLPAYILSLELTLYAKEKPWRNWASLPRRSRNTILVAALVIGLLSISALAYLFVTKFLPGYEGRLFSFQERVITQPRIIFFYISLILLPRANQFGIHHDDILLSSTLLSPWTTFPAILGLVTVVALAFYLRKKQPLISLGIFWFLVGHLLESTIFPLEMVHEHRNYLASLGIVIILVQLIYNGSLRLGDKRLLLLLPILVFMFGSLTYIRANQWSSHEKLISYNALHHPKSSRAQLELGGMLAQRGYFHEAREAYLVAIENQPYDPSLLIGLQMIRSSQKLAPAPEVDKNIVLLINNHPVSATFHKTMEHVAQCLQTSCPQLKSSMEIWANALLATKAGKTQKSLYSYYLATTLATQNRVGEAIEAYKHSYDLDKNNINPLLSLADIYAQLGAIESAEAILKYIDNSSVLFRARSQDEIHNLRNKITKLKLRNH